MSDDSKLVVSISLPPRQQYQKGAYASAKGNNRAELLQSLGELVGADMAEAYLGVFRAEAEAAIGGAVAQTLGAANPAPAPAAAPVAPVAPVAAPVAPVAATPAPAPAPAKRSAPPKVDGSQIGGTPGQAYPATAESGQPTQLGAPCEKCGVVTFWQEGFQNPKENKWVNPYWRCPNARSHPRNNG